MMVKILKSSDFRSVHAAGVYATSSDTELRFFFVNQEPIEAESGDEKNPAGVKLAPHIQAEIIISRELAQWMRNYLNAYLEQIKAATHE